MARLLHVFITAWLLFALPLGEQQALLHALSHVADAGQSDGSGPGSERCADHSLYTPYGSAMGSAWSCVPALAHTGAVVADGIDGTVLAGPRHHYLSHAPPVAPAQR